MAAGFSTLYIFRCEDKKEHPNPGVETLLQAVFVTVALFAVAKVYGMEDGRALEWSVQVLAVPSIICVGTLFVWGARAPSLKDDLAAHAGGAGSNAGRKKKWGRKK